MPRRSVLTELEKYHFGKKYDPPIESLNKTNKVTTTKIKGERASTKMGLPSPMAYLQLIITTVINKILYRSTYLSCALLYYIILSNIGNTDLTYMRF